MNNRIVCFFTLLAVTLTIASPTKERIVQPFPLNKVTLLPSQFKSNMDRTCVYLLFLNTDRMLYSFRQNYGLSTKGVQPAGGWETMAVRGHYVGNLLSALSQAYAATGDSRYKLKADTIVSELAICQNAAVSRGYSAGYLSGFPEGEVDKVLNRTPVWAPLWAIHQVFQGHIDCYTLAGNATALATATKMGDWIYEKLKNTTPTQREAMWNWVLGDMNRGEYGSFNESMVNLYDITKNPNHLAAAKFFDHQTVFGPALRNKDTLNGYHANTEIPKYLGSARIFEATGESNYYTTAKNFFWIVVNSHSYITGGTSIGEWWKGPNQIASQLADNTCESCCQYNLLKIARLLFFHESQERYMDYFERTLYNHILGTQNPRSSHGFLTYFIPLRSGGQKTYGTDYETFNCCEGTGQESQTKYGETIYAHAGDTLYVNLFIPSQLAWTEKNVTVKMETRYPDNDTVKLTLSGAGAATLPIKFRVPSWMRRSMEIWANGSLQSVVHNRGTYTSFNPAWNAGGTITVVLPQTLRFEKAPDDATVGGVMYGMQLLAGGYGTNNLSTMPTLNATTVVKTADDTLKFNATPSTGALTLVPFSRMHNQRYSVYWKLTNVPPDTFIQTNTFGRESGHPLSLRLQPPRVSIASGTMVVAFSAPFIDDQSLQIKVFDARGGVVARSRAVVRRGERVVRVKPPHGVLAPGVYVCAVRAGAENVCTRILQD